MITLIICVRRAAHVTHAFFENYWRDVHGPLVVSVPEFTRHLRSYRQFHLIDGGNGRSESASGEPWPGFDGIALLSFKDAGAMQAAFEEPRFLNILEADTLNFGNLADSPSFLATALRPDDPIPSHHGSIRVFEFAEPGATAPLKRWATNGARGPKPMVSEHYEGAAPDAAGLSDPPRTHITACSFPDVEQAAELLSCLSLQDPASLSAGPRPIHVMAREHVFI